MKSKDILTIAVFTLLTVFAWIVFDVYHTSVTSTISETQEQLLKPLDPKLNTDILEKNYQINP